MAPGGDDGEEGKEVDIAPFILERQVAPRYRMT